MQHKDRSLTVEEKSLWQRVAQTLTPLWPQKLSLPPQKIKEKPIKKTSQTPPQEGFEKHTERKLKRQTLRIEAALDLHGCSRELAYKKIAVFLDQVQTQNKRCLLIITGKGSGILKEAVLSWITQGPYSSHISSYKQAPQNLGGSGALIVLLRKKS